MVGTKWPKIIGDRREDDMTEEKIEQIIRRYDTDREFIISEAYLDGGIYPLFPRLSRAALDQLCQDAAAISRYAIWANTVRDNIRQADQEIRDGASEGSNLPLTLGWYIFLKGIRGTSLIK